MLSGVMPSIAQDLDLPLASAGMLVSAFAIGMLVGAPLMSVSRTLCVPVVSRLFGRGVAVCGRCPVVRTSG